eukprot:Phypoly_transcript_02987.p1 GENE.Phypoly_transcript_02987~~Phypoly_transcript_02987.p1  ORF type:complete len:614 (+),score=97.37 Phypoly_transcript_02987:98-1939(+)
MSSHNSNAISPSSLPLKLSMGRRTDRPDVETEYADLQRQYRVVESEKKVYTEKTQTQLKKLEAMVEKLQEDNVTLRQEIKNLEQRKQSFQQNTISPKVAELSEKISTYGEKVDAETSRLQDLENETISLQQKIKSQQDLIGGIGLTQIEHQTNGYIKTLENRLQTVLSKHSETVAQTKKIRHDIESKKREKQVFDSLARKREKDIIDRKKRMSKIVEESNYAYEARDDLQNKMFSIRERMVKETAEHEEQLIEMRKLIEQEEQRRSEIERVITALVGNVSVNAAIADPNEFQKSTKGTGGTSKNKTGTSSTAPSVVEQLLPDDDIPVLSIDDQIKKFEDFFARLSPLVGDLTDPVEIVDKIIGNEFQNFSRFNFINETHKQCDMLEASIHTLKEELEQSKKASDTGGDKIRKKLLEGLQQQLEDTEKKTEKFENKAAQCLKVFSVKEGIHEILDRLGDYRTRDLSINELNETNIWRILATISMALSPYLTGYIHSHSKEGMDVDDNNQTQNSGVLLNKTNALLGLSEGVIEDLMAQSSLVQIDPPTTGYDSTDPEDQVYPFSSEEMRLRLTGAWTGTGRDTATPSRHHRSGKMSSLKGSRSRPSTSTSALSVA